MEKTKLKKAFSAIDKRAARAAGYSMSDARAAGYSLSAAIAAGYSLSAARAAGYSLSDAIAAGYSLSDAMAAGYSLSDAIAAGYSLSDARAAGYSLSAARAAGYSMSDARAAGYSLSDARAAGYSLSAAIAAGYSLSDAIAAGYSLSDAIAAGYSLSDARAAGYSLSAAIAAGYSENDIKEWESIPVLDKPYTHLFSDIKEKRRIHRQSTWGPDKPTDEKHICDTPMCTAGHLVNMAGKIGWDLKNKYGWRDAAALIHIKTHSNFPMQDFGGIGDDQAMAYIEAAAEFEETGVNPFDDIFKAKV